MPTLRNNSKKKTSQGDKKPKYALWKKYETRKNVPLHAAHRPNTNMQLIKNPVWDDYKGAFKYTFGHLARKYLSVPATSCASERAASTSGNVVTNYRTRLLPENVNESCVLHDNDYLTEMFKLRNDKSGKPQLVRH